MACKRTVQNCKIDSPIGILTLSTCENGIHSLLLPERVFPKDNGGSTTSKENATKDFTPNLEATLNVTFENMEDNENTLKNLTNGSKWIQNYFTNPSGDLVNDVTKLPKFCHLNGTDFEINVWTTLKDTVHLGHYVSYGELAATMGNPKASRAVGTALKKNPLPLFIPCHRVIRSDGNFGKFSGGKWDGIKKFLIEHEANIAKSN